jgi:hypothetical protein
MKAYLYILAADGGFAPNPFFGCCTLACCKPAIRRRAKAGDWIVGLTPKAAGQCLAYAMRVQRSLSFEEYWNEPRFERKRPRREKGATRQERHGDNCYEPVGKGTFRQLPSDHFDNKNNREDPKAKKRDLGGKSVLIARRFAYYGANAEAIPAHLTFPRPARYNRVLRPSPDQRALVEWLDALPQGRHGRPRRWVERDRQKQEERGGCASS